MMDWSDQNTAELEQIILQAKLSEPQERTLKLSFQEQVVWLKQAEQPRNLRWQQLGRVMAKLTGNKMFVSALGLGGEQALEKEAARLRMLAEAGISVPIVLKQTRQWILLSNVGPAVHKWLRRPDSPAALKRTIVLKTAEAMAQLHQLGFWHGRPALRDMAYDGAQISFLDFEEDPAALMTPEQCMARDAFLFVHNLYRNLAISEPQLLDEVIAQYRSQCPQNVWLATRKMVKTMWFSYYLLRLLKPLSGKDGRAALFAFEVFRAA
ncbi:30S ribosomal protein S15 [Methylophaga lonarensis MPL]|uniref:30S ribosomal protein S15 n=1 Tax=Methylophaga lonarensis MPL TaxID=1286106 RepID=M7PP57_9GAMM|nr:hypothetical protein [Methylophaga lonarensis]EMR12239.1 30S ribosomal protein S15 [Methylophaga lonarensis MPL]